MKRYPHCEHCSSETCWDGSCDHRIPCDVPECPGGVAL